MKHVSVVLKTITVETLKKVQGNNAREPPHGHRSIKFHSSKLILQHTLGGHWKVM